PCSSRRAPCWARATSSLASRRVSISRTSSSDGLIVMTSPGDDHSEAVARGEASLSLVALLASRTWVSLVALRTLRTHRARVALVALRAGLAGGLLERGDLCSQGLDRGEKLRLGLLDLGELPRKPCNRDAAVMRLRQ